MNIIPVDQIPLREEAVPAPDVSALVKVCEQMQELCTKEVGVGLSAFQVGIPWKFFVMKIDGEFLNLLDCEYEGVNKNISSTEGCLSLRYPSGELKLYDVDRFERVRVFGKQLFLETKKIVDFDKEYEGFSGIVAQHEIDHHNGILISDIGKIRFF